MIIWISSYPKSGNTWLRSLLASYFFSKKGEFDFSLLLKIKQFPTEEYFINDEDPYLTLESTSKNWIKKQSIINLDKKLRFFKTHNAILQIEGNSFTDQKNSLGGIYIVRDPRNVISSIANHYQTDLNEALNFMTDEHRFIFSKKGERYLAFSPLSSWSSHVKSWTNTKLFPVLTIRYEDLHLETFETLKKVIKFIKTVSKSNISFKREKAKKSIYSCSFDKLKDLEKKEGFIESPMKKDKSGKVNFFNLGQKNNFKKMLDQKLVDKMNKIYSEELIKFKYEK
tara:strand:- start:1444 stop:2292 length:849 start_codon:yes stop_codon:yes gene_type:complete